MDFNKGSYKSLQKKAALLLATEKSLCQKEGGIFQWQDKS